MCRVSETTRRKPMRLTRLSLVLPLAASLPAQAPSPARPPAPARAAGAAAAPAAAAAGPRLPGTNAFHTVFSRNASARHDGNAYLLMYLSAVVYPEMLDKL